MQVSRTTCLDSRYIVYHSVLAIRLQYITRTIGRWVMAVPLARSTNRMWLVQVLCVVRLFDDNHVIVNLGKVHLDVENPKKNPKRRNENQILPKAYFCLSSIIC